MYMDLQGFTGEFAMSQCTVLLKPLGPRQNVILHKNIFKCIFKAFFCILIWVSLKFVLVDPSKNEWYSIQVLAWCRRVKPIISEIQGAFTVSDICIARPEIYITKIMGTSHICSFVTDLIPSISLDACDDYGSWIEYVYGHRHKYN